MSDEPSTLNRRTVLTAAGLTLGSATLGSLALGGAPSTATQESDFAPGVVWGSNSWKGAYPHQFVSVVHTPDGGYAAAGNDSQGESDDFYLVKTDGNGEPEWERSYGGSREDFVSSGDSNSRSLVQTSDGGFLIVGMSYSQGQDDEGDDWSQGWIVKTDETGDVLWDADPGADGEPSNLYAGVETADGEYAVAGRAPENKAWYVRFDADGDVVVDRQYDRTIERRWEFRSVVRASDGGLVFAGVKDLQAWVLKTDADGNWEWEDVQSSTDGHRNPFFWQDVVETPGGEFLAVGRAAEAPDATGTNALLLVDASGNRQFLRTHVGDGYDLAITPLVEGGYAVTGTDGEGSSLFKLNSSYEVVGQMTYPPVTPSYTENGWDVVQPADGEYVLAASTRLFKVSEDEKRTTETASSPTATTDESPTPPTRQGTPTPMLTPTGTGEETASATETGTTDDGSGDDCEI